MLKTTIVTSLIAVLLFAGIILPSQTFLFEPIFHQQLQSWLPESRLSIAIFLVICALLAAIGMPRQIIAFSCGYSFGALAGAISATLAASIGLTITYIFSRYFLANFAVRKLPNQSRLIIDFLSNNLTTKAFIIRILPLGSNFLTNIIAGSCQLKLKQFWLGSTLGFIPQMIIFSLVGAGVRLADQTKLIISFALFVIAIALSTILYVKTQGKKKANQKID